jgi:hypothetical protein
MLRRVLERKRIQVYRAMVPRALMKAVSTDQIARRDDGCFDFIEHSFDGDVSQRRLVK